MNSLHVPKLFNWEMERKEELEKMETKVCYSQLDLQFYRFSFSSKKISLVFHIPGSS